MEHAAVVVAALVKALVIGVNTLFSLAEPQ